MSANVNPHKTCVKRDQSVITNFNMPRFNEENICLTLNQSSSSYRFIKSNYPKCVNTRSKHKILIDFDLI